MIAGTSNGLYEELLVLLNQHGIHWSPANVHGRLCGYLTAGLDSVGTNWIQTLADDLSADTEIEGELRNLLEQLLERSELELLRRDFSFALLLPDDDAPMSERSFEIGQWCAGYMDSLRLVGDERVRSASGDAVNVIEDLERIADIGEEDEDSEDAERDFFELTEYVRLATMDLFEEFNAE